MIQCRLIHHWCPALWLPGWENNVPLFFSWTTCRPFHLQVRVLWRVLWAEDELGHFTFHLSQYSYKGSFYLSVGRSCALFSDKMFPQIFSWLNTRLSGSTSEPPLATPKIWELSWLIRGYKCQNIPPLANILRGFYLCIRGGLIFHWSLTGSVLKGARALKTSHLRSKTYVASSRMF